ncbi:translation initiation factor IF-2-like [Peromyscus leucopus]|uniref:translation initiation factor IF-2-like n=1 Tax=Peromyscus leucopus TaxID=10041 RepID=UPI001885527E|nr:translation initiation factor IF-2-like [Peromyscus leucopus]
MGRPRRPAPATAHSEVSCAVRGRAPGLARSLSGSAAPPARARGPRPPRPAVHLAVFRSGTPLLLLGEPEPEPPRELVPGGPGARAEAAVLAQLRLRAGSPVTAPPGQCPRGRRWPPERGAALCHHDRGHAGRRRGPGAPGRFAAGPCSAGEGFPGEPWGARARGSARIRVRRVGSREPSDRVWCGPGRRRGTARPIPGTGGHGLLLPWANHAATQLVPPTGL